MEDRLLAEKFDVRTLEQKIRRGVISREEVQTFLDALPDDANEGVSTETQFVSTSTRTGAITNEPEGGLDDLDS